MNNVISLTLQLLKCFWNILEFEFRNRFFQMHDVLSFIIFKPMNGIIQFRSACWVRRNKQVLLARLIMSLICLSLAKMSQSLIHLTCKKWSIIFAMATISIRRRLVSWKFSSRTLVNLILFYESLNFLILILILLLKSILSVLLNWRCLLAL